MSAQTGLTADEAARLLREHGPNEPQVAAFREAQALRVRANESAFHHGLTGRLTPYLATRAGTRLAEGRGTKGRTFTMTHRIRNSVLLAVGLFLGHASVACDHECDSCGHDEPAAPYDLAAEVRADGVSLTWIDASDDEDHFIVERSVKDAATLHFAELVELPEDTEEYLDTETTAGLTYVYRVRAVNGAVSSISDEVEVTLP